WRPARRLARAARAVRGGGRGDGRGGLELALLGRGNGRPRGAPRGGPSLRAAGGGPRPVSPVRSAARPGPMGREADSYPAAARGASTEAETHRARPEPGSMGRWERRRLV